MASVICTSLDTYVSRPPPPTPRHSAAGTGKTTVGRLIAHILHYIGVTASDAFVEASREDLVAGFVGQTAVKVL